MTFVNYVGSCNWKRGQINQGFIKELGVEKTYLDSFNNFDMQFNCRLLFRKRPNYLIDNLTMVANPKNALCKLTYSLSYPKSRDAIASKIQNFRSFIYILGESLFWYFCQMVHPVSQIFSTLYKLYNSCIPCWQFISN